MCIIAFAWQHDPRLPLVMAANRDEFHARPTAPLAPWAEDPNVIGGRDLQAGGSWLAAHRSGRIAAVTNVRTGQPPGTDLRSRGLLVTRFVRGDLGATETAQQLALEAESYAPFNLLLFDETDGWWLTNWPGVEAVALEPGVHALSNGSLNAPWPKTRQLAQDLTRLASGLALADDEQLLAALAREDRPPDSALPRTGVSLERERFVSPVFIRGSDYGTKASSLLRWRSDGTINLFERRFGPEGQALGDTRL